MTAEELHEKFRAELAEARSKDREESGRVFLSVNIPLGRFWLAPLTLERYLFLEQVKSPFLGFGSADDPIPTKADVLHFLWIMSPKFRPEFKAGRRFALRHYFINWRRYTMLIYELITEQVAPQLQATEGKQEGGEVPTNWVATLIDGAASQYGWSERQILDLPVMRARAYMEAMSARLTGGKAAAWAKNADKVRHEYISKLNKFNAEEKN